MTRQKMTGGEAVVAQLLAHDVDTIFGIPGGQNLAIYDALCSERARIRHLLGRHEQGLTYMADGYSRASGRLGVVTTTSGPGVANMACAMAQATTDTSSVLAVSSTVHSELIGKNRGGLHDHGESLEIMRAVCRYAVRCETVDEIPAAVHNLIVALRDGRPGGAYLEIPCDVLGERAAVEILPAGQRSRPAPDDNAVCQAVELLADAQRPVLWVGTGATLSDAGAEVAELAERLGAAVVMTVLGRGLLPADDPHVVMADGALMTEVSQFVAEADVVLAVGTMFKQEDTAAWEAQLGEQLIHIDIDPDEQGRSYSPTVSLVADAKAALAAILQQLPSRSPAPPAWIERGRQAEAARLDQRRSASPTEMQALDILRDAVPRDGVIVCDRCNLGYWFFRCGPSYVGRTFQYPMGYGGLGGALPQAIGSKLAQPFKPVVCVIGDGGFQFTGTELATAVQEQVPITIVLCNNQGFGAIRAGQDRGFGGRRYGVDLINPDFQKLAAAHGIPASRCDSLDEFADQLPAAVRAGDLRMVELTVDLADP